MNVTGSREWRNQWKFNAHFTAYSPISRTSTPTEYLDVASIPWQIRRFPIRNFSVQKRSFKELFNERRDTFLACFGSYFFARLVQELTILRNYFPTSSNLNSFLLSRVSKSLRLARRHTCLWTLFLIFLISNRSSLFENQKGWLWHKIVQLGYRNIDHHVQR